MREKPFNSMNVYTNESRENIQCNKQATESKMTLHYFAFSKQNNEKIFPLPIFLSNALQLVLSKVKEIHFLSNAK